MRTTELFVGMYIDSQGIQDLIIIIGVHEMSG